MSWKYLLIFLDQTGNIVDSDVMPRDEYDSLREIEPGTEVELGDDGLPVETNEPLSENPIISEARHNRREWCN